MKRILVLLSTLIISQMVAAADLLEVYQQALTSDPTYQQAISQRLSTKEGVPISLSSLLPNISLNYSPSVNRQNFSGANLSNGSNVRTNTVRAADLALTLSQTVFNVSQFFTLASALATSKQADAILNTSLQSLMTRVSSAYFDVLRAEDNLSYNNARMLAYKEQLDQVKQQYDVGLKTITEVYTARASYMTSAADYYAAQNTVSNTRENLRVITGKYYAHLAPLSENFPLMTPQPSNVDEWVKTALQQNWAIKAAQYNVDSARQTIRAQFGGHMPTVTLQGTMDRQYSQNINGYAQALNQRRGPSVQRDNIVTVNFDLPIFQGGGVVAQTNQATYNYEIAQQQLELTQRNTVNTTRQSYSGILAGISQIKADREAIKSSISSLHGMEASYNVGTEILVNVLNQQQKVFEAQTQYAQDRYEYVNNFLALKQAAGTLGFTDLRAVNVWLRDNETTESNHMVQQYLPRKHSSQTKKTSHKFAQRAKNPSAQHKTPVRHVKKKKSHKKKTYKV